MNIIRAAHPDVAHSTTRMNGQDRGPYAQAACARRIARRLLTAVVSLSVMGATCVSTVVDATRAEAITNFPTATIAQDGLANVGQYGGECIAFAFNMIQQASGGTVTLPGTMAANGGYYQSYPSAGGVSVSVAAAQEGDVIQLYNPRDQKNYYNGMHTAIIVSNLGGGSFDVVDSNWNWTTTVKHHTWSNVPGYAAGFGLNVGIWQFGATNPFSYRLNGAPQVLSPSGNAVDLSHAWAGERATMVVNVINTGTSAWDSNVRVAVPDGSTSDLTDPGWFNSRRPAAVTGTVAPGQAYRFTFPVTIGLNPANSFVDQFNLVDEGVAWFPSASGFSVAVTDNNIGGFGVAMRHHGPGGYSLAPDGTVTAFGGAPALANTSSMWPDWDIARGIVLRSDDLGGYVLDGWGGLHQFGNAPAMSATAYWSGWDIARGIVLRSDNLGGYVLDGWGGLHQFGNAPAMSGTGYWSGWDIARGIVLRSDNLGGYVLDGWGGLHQFGNAAPISVNAYWSGWDIAKAVSLATDTSGVVLDGAGGAHSFGS